VKIINNMIAGSIAAATAEALVLGVKAGADLETMTKIIGVSTGASWQLSNQFPLRAFNGSFQPGFMTDLLHKDFGLALDLAAENQTPVAMAAQAHLLYEMTRASGHGRDDYTSVMQFLEEMAGVEVRIKGE
jgi:3-hydroxyisobutyrate dehydrogenase-like beta-hydroxyacid dehydrogenase